MSHSSDYNSAANIALKALTQFLNESELGKVGVLHRPVPEEIIADLDIEFWLKNGGLAESKLVEFLQHYLKSTTRLHHPCYMAHQVSAPNALASVADMIHGAINNPMAVYEMGPANTSIELAVLNWMLKHIGWDSMSMGTGNKSSSGGVLTHGGSLANLTALLAARADLEPNAWNVGTPNDLVVLCSSEAHYSVARSISIIGLGQNAMVALPCDKFGRILPDKIHSVIEQQKINGKRIMAIVASACSTGTGLFDPLREIGEICQRESVWLHVDAAHGAPALLSADTAFLLDGITLADSVIWDAHKMMQTSALCTAVLTKKESSLDNTFHQNASYLIYDHQLTGIDFLNRTIECTKAGLGLKAFFAIAFQGTKAMGDFVASRFNLTKQFYEVIKNRPGFECPYEPQSNILCFRYGRDSEQQVKIREELLANETFHIKSVNLSGSRYLRLTVMNDNTNLETLEKLLKSIENCNAIKK